MLEKQKIFIISHSISSLQCFILLISVKDAIIFGFMNSLLKLSRKSTVYQLYNLLGIDTDPDRDLAK
jgi:hypothetical protein